MNQPMKFVLGSESFIKGSEEGIVGMKTGGQRTIVIPSYCAYGPEGMGPIPPNTNIRVMVELVSTKAAVAAKMWDVDSTLFKTTASGLKYAMVLLPPIYNKFSSLSYSTPRPSKTSSGKPS